MLLGYARVSTTDQNLDVQVQQLEQSGCEKIFAEQKSGKTMDAREELDKCIKYAREGDTVIVCRLDRLARSMRDFCEILRILEEKKVGFRCLNPGMDTTGPTGKLTAHVLAAVAEFELNLRKERQREGIEAAKAKGVYARGRTRAKDKKRNQVMKLIDTVPGISAEAIAKRTGISVRNVYRLTPGCWGDLPAPLQRSIERKKELLKEPVQF